MKKKRILRRLHNDLLRTITLIAGCAVVLAALDDNPGWKNLVVAGVGCLWLYLFFHQNAAYFERRQMYLYYSTMRPVSIGTYPSGRKVLAVHNFDKPIRVGNYHVWGVVGFKGELTDKEKDVYDLVPCEHPEKFEVTE